MTLYVNTTISTVKGKPFLGLALLLLAALACPGYAAEPPAILSAAALAGLMRQASYSDGFEARMDITTAKPGGQRTAPVKLAVIGQFGAERQRLLIRGISPDKVRNHFFAAEKGIDGRIRSVEYGEHIPGIKEADPFAKVFDTGLVIWDMLVPWWNWPKQSLGGTEQIAGRYCFIVHSQAGADASPMRKAVSCVDRDAGISLRTQLFDGRRTPVRTISVTQTVGKESGMMAAKELSVTDADNSTTWAEIYGGDEHYSIAADTFAALDSLPVAGK